MSTYATYLDHRPQSLCSASGWRVAYLDASTPSGWFADPVVAFTLCRVTQRPCHGNMVDRVRDEGIQVHALVAGDYIACVEEIVNFWRYLGPSDPDPTAEQAAAEQARRAQRQLEIERVKVSA